MLCDWSAKTYGARLPAAGNQRGSADGWREAGFRLWRIGSWNRGACLPGFEAGYGGFCNVWAFTQVKQAASGYLAHVNIWDHGKKHGVSRCLQTGVKEASDRWLNGKTYLENPFVQVTCQMWNTSFLRWLFYYFSWDADRILHSTSLRCCSTDNNIMQRLS